VVDHQSRSAAAVCEVGETEDGHGDVTTFAVDEAEACDEDGRCAGRCTHHVNTHTHTHTHTPNRGCISHRTSPSPPVDNILAELILRRQ